MRTREEGDLRDYIPLIKVGPNLPSWQIGFRKQWSGWGVTKFMGTNMPLVIVPFPPFDPLTPAPIYGDNKPYSLRDIYRKK